MAKKYEQLPELREHIKSLDSAEREALKRATGTNYEYLLLCAGGHRRIGPQLAKRVSEYTGLPMHQLRPDLWDAA